MFCPNCGKEVSDNTNFCGNCGFAIQSDKFAPGQFAGFWKRVAALLIDSLILYAAIATILQMLLGAYIPDLFQTVQDGQMTAQTVVSLFTLIYHMMLWSLVFTVGLWLYHALMESSKYQGSFGKMALGIVVTDEKGEPIGFGRATGRYFGKYLSAMIFGIGFLMAAFTEKKQGLHDMMAGTLVLNKKRTK